MNNSSNASTNLTHVSKTPSTTWCVTYGLVAFAIIFSNAVTIAAFRNSRLLLRLSMFFLVNLSIADMTVGAVALPMYIYLIYSSSAMTSAVPDTNHLKIFQNIHISIDVFTGMASVFTLTIIALERLTAISYPIWYRTISKTSYFAVLSCIWLVAGVLSGMHLLAFSSVIPESVFIYSLVLLSLASLCFISLAYPVLWIKLKVWSNTQGRIAGGRESNLAMPIALITTAFLVTWLPFYILNIIVNFKVSLLNGIPRELVYSVKLLHYSNSFMNPIIYSFKMPEFRSALQGLLFRRKRFQTTRV